MPLLRAFRLVTEQPGYAEKLEGVMDRVSAIESLGRTREVRQAAETFKCDLLADFPLSQLVWKEQGDGGKFLIRSDGKGQEVESWTLLGGDERLGRTDDKDQDST